MVTEWSKYTEQDPVTACSSNSQLYAYFHNQCITQTIFGGIYYLIFSFMVLKYAVGSPTENCDL